MNLLLFINIQDVKNFFELILEKYILRFPKFIKYFYKNFFIDFPLNKMYWNYYY